MLHAHESCTVASHLTGHFAECGVYRGGTALLLARALSDDANNRRLYLFDSFKGLPKVNENIDPWFSEGHTPRNLLRLLNSC